MDTTQCRRSWCQRVVVQSLSHVWLFATPWTAAHQAPLVLYHLLELAQTHVHRVGDAIQLFSSSVVPFSPCPQSFPASGSLLMSRFFASGGQSTGVSDSASVLPVDIQGWFPLGLTGLISLLSKDKLLIYWFFPKCIKRILLRLQRWENDCSIEKFNKKKKTLRKFPRSRTKRENWKNQNRKSNIQITLTSRKRDQGEKKKTKGRNQ